MKEGNSSLLEGLWKEAVLFLSHSSVLKGSGSLGISRVSKVVSTPLKGPTLKTSEHTMYVTFQNKHLEKCNFLRDVTQGQ
jgi:hypothetical protein